MFAVVYLIGTLLGLAVGSVLAFLVVLGSGERTFGRLLCGLALIAGGGYAGFRWCVPVTEWLLSNLK
jgi:hypothetical protein